MKKVVSKCNTFVLTAIIAALILLAIMGINGLLYSLAGFIIGIPMSGGEITVTYGPGMILEHYYPLTAEPVSDSTSLEFSLALTIFCYLIFFVISIFIARSVKEKAEWSLIREGK